MLLIDAFVRKEKPSEKSGDKQKPAEPVRS
jgi:hypothetical protein